LLLRICERVDVVEPIAKFTEGLKTVEGVGVIHNVGLEEWQPDGTQYDLIWTQWCVGHLTDDQLVSYLQLCKTVLTPETGLIVVKENQSTGDSDVFDEVDSSVTR
jgi:protein N-terminal methyltransferase